MANPFVTAVMGAFKGKLPKPDRKAAKTPPKPAKEDPPKPPEKR